MANYVTPTSDKSKGVCLVLWFVGIFGMFPIYYWYVGRRMGLVRVFTANFFWIGALIDLISIATGSFTDNVGMPIRK